jgi:hypothetical protein
MHSVLLLDCAGRRRSPATVSGFHQGQPPRNKGLRYPPDPPTVEEIVAVMRVVGDGPDGLRLRGVIAVLWRPGWRHDRGVAEVVVQCGSAGIAKQPPAAMSRAAWWRVWRAHSEELGKHLWAPAGMGRVAAWRTPDPKGRHHEYVGPLFTRVPNG